MKCLIVSANRTKAPFPVPPVGAAMVAEALSKRGFESRFLDLCFSMNPARDIEKELANAPCWVGLSVRNIDPVDYRTPYSCLPYLKELCAVIGRRQIPIILGGTAVAIAPEALLAGTGARAAFVGDAESFVSRLERGEGLPRGVVRGQGDSVPSYEGVEKWIHFIHYLKYSKQLPLRFSHGCAFQCSYCPYPVIEGKSRYPKSLITEKAFARRWLEQGFAIDIIDALFNEPHDRAVALCRELAKDSLQGNYHISALSPLSVSEELFEGMEKIGANHAMVSADSAAESMLTSYNKPFGREHLDRFNILRQGRPLSVLWNFIVGGPGESDSTVEKSMNFIESLPENDAAYVTPGVRIYPHTALHRQALEEGIVKEGDSLLEPRFYFSRSLEREKLLSRLRKWESGLDHVFLSTRGNGPLGHLGLRFFGGAGTSPPWKIFPRYKRWMRRVGLLNLLAPA